MGNLFSTDKQIKTPTYNGAYNISYPINQQYTYRLPSNQLQPTYIPPLNQQQTYTSNPIKQTTRQQTPTYKDNSQHDDLIYQFRTLSISTNKSIFDPTTSFTPIKVNSSLIYEFLKGISNENYIINNFDAIYEVTLLDNGSIEFNMIKELFTNTNRKCYTVNKIQKIYNPYLLGQYELMKKCYTQRYGYILEMELFHGTRKINLENICKYNFNWRLKGTACGHKFGQGVSFTPIANYATHYGDKTFQKVMILSKVLVSNDCIGNKDTVLPLFNYDTTTNENKHVFVKYEDNTFYPTYIIHYEGMEGNNQKYRNRYMH